MFCLWQKNHHVGSGAGAFLIICVYLDLRDNKTLAIDLLNSFVATIFYDFVSDFNIKFLVVLEPHV